MTEQIHPEFPNSNVLSERYRAELMIEEVGYKTFFFHFSKVEDPRKENGKRHQLTHILILTIIGILRGLTRNSGRMSKQLAMSCGNGTINLRWDLLQKICGLFFSSLG